MTLDADIRVERGDFVLDVSIGAAQGQTIGVLGPNGAGKTTLLRVLAGLVPLSGGRLCLDGRVLDEPGAGVYVAPEKRPVGVVFQDYLLFPHLTALQNVAFGLRSRGVSKSEAHRRAAGWLDRVGLADRAGDKPGRLSGGQAQRVALARALVTEPALLLLDEPLAALDVTTRAELRRNLLGHLASFPGVRVLVTHDPLEAAALCDRVVVVEGGRVVQEGTHADLTSRPRSAYVAQLAGTNLFTGTSVGGRVLLAGGASLAVSPAGSPHPVAEAPTGAVLAVVHPTAVVVGHTRPEGSARNVWPGTVEDVDRLGDRCRVRVSGPVPIVAEVTLAAAVALGLAPGVAVWASVKATEISVYPA